MRSGELVHGLVQGRVEHRGHHHHRRTGRHLAHHASSIATAAAATGEAKLAPSDISPVPSSSSPSAFFSCSCSEFWDRGIHPVHAHVTHERVLPVHHLLLHLTGLLHGVIHVLLGSTYSVKGG
jgi:hypothetical protein